MGTNEQIMAWFMDTYSMYQGRTVTEIVTGKPVASGGTEGRREATGRGVAYLVDRAMERLGIAAGRRHRDRAGVRQCRQRTPRRRWPQRGPEDPRRVGSHRLLLRPARAWTSPRCCAHAATHDGVLAGFSNQLAFDPRELLAQKCDVLVPAAMERVIDADDAPAGCNAACWRKAPTARPRRRRTRCWTSGATRSSSSPTSCATPAAWSSAISNGCRTCSSSSGTRRR